MTFPKPVIWAIYLLLAAVIISGSLWLGARHRADERLAAAHLTYGRGCSGCVRSRPNVQVDVFGDGTVVFQEDTDDRSFVTHLDARAVKAFFETIDRDPVLRKVPPQTGIDAPYCHIVFLIGNNGYESGCVIVAKDANGTTTFRDHPQITQLEVLVGLEHLRSFDHTHPPSGIELYKPSGKYAVEPLFRIPPPLVQ